MIVVLDSNEYINHLEKKPKILDKIFLSEGTVIYINEIIVEEVLRNINELQKKEFYLLISRHKIVAYDKKISLDLLQKYKTIGLKKGDIAIAAFCEGVKANYLVTENRHFLKSRKFEKFGVLSLKDFLTKLK